MKYHSVHRVFVGSLVSSGLNTTMFGSKVTYLLFNISYFELNNAVRDLPTIKCYPWVPLFHTRGPHHLLWYNEFFSPQPSALSPPQYYECNRSSNPNAENIFYDYTSISWLPHVFLDVPLEEISIDHVRIILHTSVFTRSWLIDVVYINQLTVRYARLRAFKVP